jgi:hypothetical protein
MNHKRTDNGKSDLLFNFIFACILDFFVQFFDQIRPNPVFDVMLHYVSSHRAEGASPVLPPQLHPKNAVTVTNLQLHVPSKLGIACYLIFKRAGSGGACRPSKMNHKRTDNGP